MRMEGDPSRMGDRLSAVHYPIGDRTTVQQPIRGRSAVLGLSRSDASNADSRAAGLLPDSPVHVVGRCLRSLPELDDPAAPLSQMAAVPG
jgi:hypothetical protein